MPISSDANETNELYFWFFPSENPKASDEILIWLNGGVSWPASLAPDLVEDLFLVHPIVDSEHDSSPAFDSN